MDKEEGVIPYGLENGVKEVITLDQISEKISEMDYVFFSLPNIKHPYILDKNMLQKLKKGVIIVKIGRSKVIDEEALFEGIKRDIIHGAALDVWNN